MIEDRIKKGTPQPELPAVEVDTTELDRAVGERVRALRLRHKATQETLGRAIGRNKSMVSKIERGLQAMFVRDALAIAKALDVELSELVGEN